MTVSVADRREVEGRTFPGPTARPARSVRVAIGVLAVSVGAFNVALMLSDRAPGITRRLFGDTARRLKDELRQSDQIGSLAEGRNPGSDAIVHIGVWAVAMTLIGLAVWRWRQLIIGALLLFIISVVIEIGQGRYSTSRNVEMSDVVANAVGVALGVATCAVCYIAWSTFAAVRARRVSA